MLFIPDSCSAKHRKLSSLFYIQTKEDQRGYVTCAGGGGGGHEAVQRPGFDPGGAVLESEARRMIPPFLS